MAIEVYPNIFKVEIPLPKNPLRELHCYIIKSKDRNLIIDTGFNIQECKDALMEGIGETKTDLKKTDLLITHLHTDHSGLASALSKEGVNVYAGKIDGEIINRSSKSEYWEKFVEYIKLFDLEKDNVTFQHLPGYKFSPKEHVKFLSLVEGDIINVGDYSFNVVDIPGHTPGHIGLYERRHKLFFCGDHILGKITPNITFWGFEKDILEVFFESLKKVYDYDIEHLFTAHRDIVPNHQIRINELLEHHRVRLIEILNIIKDEWKTVRDTAASMHWEVRGKTWVDFPDAQKWFASGETMSHLEHLYQIGKAEKITENGVLYFKAI